MKKNTLKRFFALSMSLAMVCSLEGVTTMAATNPVKTTDFKQEMEEKFADSAMANRPYARWWLAEGSHTDETLKDSVKELYEDGYGGIEFVTLDESDYLDNEDYAWGSAEWIHDSQLIISECAKYGMSVSMTSGTHWSTANLTVINPDMQEASQELGYTTTETFQGSYKGELALCELPDGATKQKLVSIVAAKVVGEKKLAFDSFEVVDAQEVTDEDGKTTAVSVDYTAPDDGDYMLFAFYQYGTGEYYQPATTGKSYTINYLDTIGSNALINYWDENVLTDEMQSLINQIDECDMYMDSLELQVKGSQTTGHLWCQDMLQEVKDRAGYDMEKYLPMLIFTGGFGATVSLVYSVDTEEGQDFVNKMNNDFYQVQTELYTENCLEVLSDWLHGKNMKLRAENSYGKLFEISEPIKVLDYVETESFEYGTELESFRLMSGGAHLYNKRFSSETGAAAFANYVYNNGYYRNIFYMEYAGGIQKVVTHGYSSPYGPEGRVSWPGYEGMMDMFSERFNQRQPGSIDYTELNQHLSRLQTALEAGTSQMDLLMLRTDYNANNSSYCFAYLNNNDSAGNDNYDSQIHNHKGIYWQNLDLQDHGYTYDYASPYCLNDSGASTADGCLITDGVSYQAVVVMEDELPLQSAKNLLTWAKEGLNIIFVNNVDEMVQNDFSMSLAMFGMLPGVSVEEGEHHKINTIAGSTTGCNDNGDQELAQIVAEIKSQENVTTVDSVDEAYDGLQSIGVSPRAEQVTPNDKLLTVLRKDGDVSYLYVYNYMYEETENYTGQISIDGIYQPYELDTWTGDVAKIDNFTASKGRTTINVDIAPGEVALFILNGDEAVGTTVKSVSDNVYKVINENGQTKAAVSESGKMKVKYSNGTTYTQTVKAPKNIELTGWDLTVDSYTPGEKVTREEDSAVTEGLHTVEVSYTTNHTDIHVGKLDELVPWKDIEALGEYVVGVGTYTTTFKLPSNYSAKTGGVVFNAESFNYGTAAIFVNGERVLCDMDRAEADISAYVKPGKNTISVRVTSSLRNIMNKLGYDSGWMGKVYEADSYGMTGKTTLTTYTKVTLPNMTKVSKANLLKALKYLKNHKTLLVKLNTLKKILKYFFC